MSIIVKELDLYDIHDKHQYFTKQSFGIKECIESLIQQEPFGKHAFYIFAHPRTNDHGQKELLWQPRLTKPSCETNSMLFKVKPGSDEVKITWMIPEPHLWSEYEKGKVCESNIINESIRQFRKNRNSLEEKEPDDLSEEQILYVYKEMLESKKNLKT